MKRLHKDVGKSIGSGIKLFERKKNGISGLYEFALQILTRGKLTF
jgi:hypothetical protein